MKFDINQYRREMFAKKMKVHDNKFRNVRVIRNGVYMESLRGDGKWDRGVVPDTLITEWAGQMWPSEG